MDDVSVGVSVGKWVCNPLILRVSVGSVGICFFYAIGRSYFVPK